MYTHAENVNGVEAVCYEHGHQEMILSAISKEFEKVFPSFIDSEAGQLISEDDFTRLQRAFKVIVDKKKVVKNRRENFISIIKKSIDEFENNRKKYYTLMDLEMLEEFAEDYNDFKATTLKVECPIIHATLFTNRPELKQYKMNFKAAAPKRLYDVVYNLSKFCREYVSSYNEEVYQGIQHYEELGLSTLEESGDKYTAYGVIGGGIRSHILYKIHPECFPNRSQWALWALWHLCGKEDFGCEMNSEFLMIDVKSVTTQQNYCYPYDLFTFYMYKIFKLLDEKAKEMGVLIDPCYRYVIVDAFMNYVYDLHKEEIAVLCKQIPNGGYGYA